MSALFIDFEWPRHLSGYQLVQTTRADRALMLKPAGDAVEIIRPLELNRMLFAEFAKLKEPADCLRFANRFGLLGGHKYKARPRADRDKPHLPEPVSNWLLNADGMRQFVEAWRRDPGGTWIDTLLGRDHRLTQLDVSFRRTPPDAKLRLAIRPRDLAGAMVLQFGQTAASGLDVYPCDWCGTWFERGIGGKRTDARYCSTAHRIAHHNAKQKETNR